MASTISPTRKVSERPTGMMGRLPISRSQNGNVRVRVLPDDGGIGDASVGELHPDRIGAGDDVLIRDDGAHRIDDHARAQAALDALPIARPIVAEQLIERGGLRALRDDPRGVDIDHRRRGARHRIGKTLHDHRGRCGDGASALPAARAVAAGAATARQCARPAASGFHQTTRNATARPTTTALTKKLTRTRVFCN